ncbi:MAG: cephalosporin hydroxylase [Acidobacteria bacterium]|jgi:cephalosporin hydroxylase|nr:cephalosporin hydroxylase [Acidobacteriota bacterium]|tara:strand:+ start:42 stop:827 length:786 start_codon:yes stop_codon:yes gene_type:complete
MEEQLDQSSGLNPSEQFRHECAEEVRLQGEDLEFLATTQEWIDRSMHSKYSLHFEWMGRPIIQYPQDIVAMQEILFTVQPDLIIETGVAHGGSLVFYSSMLELISSCGGPSEAAVVGIDIEIRPHNREAIEAHPMAKRIRLIEGSSTAATVVDEVQSIAAQCKQVLVCLDSLHSAQHVLAELQAYAPLTSVGSYCVVFDTIAEKLPQSYFDAADRRCAPGNSPMTAVHEFLGSNEDFEVDRSVFDKLLISVAPGGYLKRVS